MKKFLALILAVLTLTAALCGSLRMFSPPMTTAPS